MKKILAGLVVPLALFALVGCGAVSPPAQTGALDVLVGGLPAQARAELRVSGPGFSQVLTGSQELSNLAPGTYTVTASPASYYTAQATVTAGASPVTVAVAANASATAQVTYRQQASAQELWLSSGADGPGTNAVVGFSAAQLAAGLAQPSNQVGGTFQDPVAVAADPVNGSVWIADGQTEQIYGFAASQLSASGLSLQPPAVVLSSSDFIALNALAFDASGNLWVASNSSVLKLAAASLAATGTVAPVASLSFPGSELNALAFDASGNLWAGGSGESGGLVAEFPSNPLASGSSLSTRSPVTGLAFSPSGNLWLATGNDNLKEVAATDLPQLSLSAVTVASGLQSPGGLAFDASGNLWVAEMNLPSPSGDGGVVEFPSAQLTSSSPEPLLHPVASQLGENSGAGVGDLAISGGTLWFVDGATLQASSLGQLLTSPSGAQFSSALQLASPVNDPEQMAFSASGDLWVVNDNTNLLEEYTPAQLQTADPQPSAVISGPALSQPTGLAFDARGDLWVSNYQVGASSDGSLLEFTPAQLAASGSPTPAAQVSSPALYGSWGLAFDSGGNLWVANYYQSTLLEYSAQQLLSASLASPANAVYLSGNPGPEGPAFAPGGDLWLAAYSSDQAVALTPAQLQSSSNPSNPVTPAIALQFASFTDPWALAFDASGNLWVALNGEGALVEFTPNQLVSGTAAPARTLSAPNPYFPLFGPQLPSAPLQGVTPLALPHFPLAPRHRARRR